MDAPKRIGVDDCGTAWAVPPPPEAGPCTRYVRADIADIADEMLAALLEISHLSGPTSIQRARKLASAAIAKAGGR